jgi:KDO2-lipid IV(A) lauroyltransferase
MKKIRYVVEAIIGYFCFYMFLLFPFEIASTIGGFLGRMIGPKMGITRRIKANLTKALPNANQDQIIKDLWTHLGRMIAEYPHLYKFARKDFFEKYITVKGAEHIRKAAQDENPSLMIAGHLGNWELNAVAAFHHQLYINMIYRKPNNPFMDALFQRARGNGIFANFYPKGKEGAKALIKSLKSGESIGMLVDQKMNEGIASKFFHADAMTTTSPAEFALKYKAPIYMARVIRLKGAHFKVEVKPLKYQLAPKASKAESVRTIIDEINKQLESWIKEHPSQWLWMHNRWPK